MSTLVTAYLVEHRKLRHSLAIVLVATAPALVAIFLFFDLLQSRHPQAWDMWMMQAAAIWAFFMLPMSVTALTLLVAQTEHVPHSWSHLHALPVPRWHFLAAKALWVCTAVALMTAATAVGSWLAIHAAILIKPAMTPNVSLHAAQIALLFFRIGISSLLLIVVQLWLALRWTSFVPALATGIGGTFFAVVANSAKIGVILPWQIPLNALANDPLRAHVALLIGSLCGVPALAWMMVRLSRRETVG